MSQSLAQLYVHLIYSTKNRQPLLRNKQMRDDLFGYVAGVCHNLDCPSLIVGGWEDHMHLLYQHSKNIAVSTIVRELKRESSKWMKEDKRRVDEFYWQAGYGAFSVSPSHVPALKRYIQNQDAHHHQESFQDEFRRICQKYGVEIDEAHCWE